MIDFLLNDLNIVFTISLLIVAGIALLEGVAVLIGVSVMGMLDDLIDIDLSAEADVSQSGLTSLLGWLCLNRLPMLVWLILLLTGFAISGISYNFLLTNNLNIELLYWFRMPIAVIGSLYFTHFMGTIIANIIPKNETSAVSSTGFSGKVATITMGKASVGNAAQAVLKDEFNQKHYVMVEPENKQDIFPQGMNVVLIEKTNTSWIAVKLEQ